ncbi:uncharacterized protein LOC131692152 [Topomyia yanbarensis]|uniref:uncharacterized protein LOC131692152 n=1 Tax=Topomyia yanbarensis TaxID=2498891 RepID=UPI00273C8D54|nr:uncharacterized protein LOC131692152 [Topomyia yanbarensis]
MKHLILVVLWFCCASADVNELLYKPEPYSASPLPLSDPEPADANQSDPQPIPEHLEARPYNVLSNSINNEQQFPVTLEHLYGAVQVEEPAGVPYAFVNDDVEIVDALEILPLGNPQGELVQFEPWVKTVQLTAAHADYQGPYHYEKPKLQLEYGAPDAPKLDDGPSGITNDYLPPRLTRKSLAKRQLKLIDRRVA